MRGSRDARVAAIAAHQRGRVRRRQLLGAGLTSGQIHHLARSDRLFTEFPGVYAVGSPAEVELGRETSALLAAADGALLSDQSGARVWDLTVEDADPTIHLTVSGHWIPRLPGVTAHRSRILTPADRRVHRRLPVCSPARVLLDLAAHLDDAALIRLLDDAQIRRIVGLPQIAALLDRSGRHRGVARLRGLIADASAGVSESEAERLLDALLAQADLPRAQRQVRIGGYRLDHYWAEARLGVEVDGFATHSNRRRFEADRVRDARLQTLHDVHVIRVTWLQMTREPLAVVARIAAAYGQRVQAR